MCLVREQRRELRACFSEDPISEDMAASASELEREREGEREGGRGREGEKDLW